MKVCHVLERNGRAGTEAYVAATLDRLAATTSAEVATVGSGDGVLRPAHTGRRGVLPALRGARGGVVHLHLYTSLLPVVALARLVGGVRVVTTFHLPLTQWSWRHRLAWRWAARLSHACAGVSRDCLDSFGATLADKPTAVIPAALPLDDLTPRAGPLPHDPRAWRIAASGRLEHQKDWPTLLRAVASLRRAGRPVALTLYGDGGLRGELETLARELDLDPAAVFAGHTPRADLLAALRDADLFVLPSRFEGLGISAVEAMAVGLATITADFPASADYIVEGETGTRFPRGDWRALADRIARHMDHPDEAAALAARGRAFVVDRFSPENTFDRYLELYGGA